MTAVAEKRGPASVLPLLVAVALIPAALGSSTTIFNDGDVSWHIATGQWIIDHRAIPHSDPFSFTWAGKPWVPIEWLAEVMYAAAYRLAGYSGVSALVTAALIALHALVYFNAVRFVRPWAAVAAVVAMDLVFIPMMLARPHVLAWVLVAAWLWLMLRAREQGRAPPLPAALLMTIWANLHGSFVIGLVIAAAFGLEALLFDKDRVQALRQWVIFGAACALAVLINANGIEGLLHPLRIANLAMLPLIDEWKPSSVAGTPFFFAVLAAVIALLVWKRPKVQPVRFFLLLFLLGLALLQMRHQAVLAIVAAMLIPTAFTSRHEGHGLVEMRWAGLAASILVVARLLLPIELPYNSANPWKLIAQVPAELHSQPVLNGYGMGGPLILSGIRPYVDGRGDMYGDDLVVGYKQVIDGDPSALAESERRWGIKWAILPLQYRKLIALLDRSRGWRRIYGDEVGVIYVRS
jgi:hypothetical protein